MLEILRVKGIYLIKNLQSWPCLKLTVIASFEIIISSILLLMFASFLVCLFYICREQAIFFSLFHKVLYLNAK